MYKTHYFIFDLLRIIAITLVVTAHLAQTLRIPILDGFYGIPHFYYVSLGGVGVSIFLLISGAVLGLSSPKDYKTFVVHRLYRIYPAYWCSVVIILMGYAIRSHLPKLEPMDLLLAFTGMYSLAGRWSGPLNGVYWFIGLIMILYLIYPLIAESTRKWGYVALLGLLIISVLSRWYLGQIEGNGRMIDWFPLCRVFEFGLGVFIVERELFPKALTTHKVVYILSNLSFYIFLIHSPLLFLAKANLLLFVASVMVLSHVVYLFDSKVIRPLIY